MEKTGEQRKCVICGRAFIPARNNKVVCSERCQRERTLQGRRLWQKRDREAILGASNLRCEICGKKYKAKSLRQKTCSPACEHERLKALYRASYERRKLRAAGKAESLKCIVCGREFERKRNGQKTCSRNCYNKYLSSYKRSLANNYYISDVDWLNCRLEKAQDIIRELFALLEGGSKCAKGARIIMKIYRKLDSAGKEAGTGSMRKSSLLS